MANWYGFANQKWLGLPSSILLVPCSFGKCDLWPNQPEIIRDLWRSEDPGPRTIQGSWDERSIPSPPSPRPGHSTMLAAEDPARHLAHLELRIGHTRFGGPNKQPRRHHINVYLNDFISVYTYSYTNMIIALNVIFVTITIYYCIFIVMSMCVSSLSRFLSYSYHYMHMYIYIYTHVSVCIYILYVCL